MMNIARMVFPGFWFGQSSEEEAIRLAGLGVGGFCLYGGTKTAVATLTRKLRAASPLPRILIAADYEDGLGRWLPDAELLPSNLAIGASHNEKLAFEKGFITGQEALSLGVDWVFAPVVDLANNSQNPIVNTRSFGEDPEQVTRLAGAFMQGLNKGGVLNCLKHFPGHGNTTTDSHLDLPVVSDSLSTLKKTALLPFQALLPLADSVMIGHLLVPALDEQNPASLSKTIIHKLLQEAMGFTRCICTDALLMKALGDENVRQDMLKTWLFGITVMALMFLGRAVLSFFFGASLAAALGFFTTEVITVLFTLVILWIVRRLDGVFENQNHYLLRLREEQEKERGGY